MTSQNLAVHYDMVIRITIIVSLTLLDYVSSTKVLPTKDICPKVCHCYYVGKNWLTDCSESNLMTLPLEGLDPNVYTLNVNMNHLEKIDLFPSNIKVRNLQLSFNSLTTIEKETFSGLQYLLDIDLSFNLINFVHPEAFIENAGFVTLKLQNNPLKSAEGPFLYSNTLRFLYLANCQLTTLSHQFFVKINRLIKVDLTGNPLRTIEPGVFDHLNTLKHLILNNINLIQITNVAQHHYVLVSPNIILKNHVNWTLTIGKLLFLEQLELKQSGLSNLPDNLFSNHICLKSLVLAENQLSNSDLDTTLGQNLVNIDYLDLSHCTLKAPISKYAFAKATKLRTLILSGNYLSTSDLGVAFSSLSKLSKLSLSNCGLIELRSNTFQNISSLKELDISMNPLHKFFSGAFSTINRLESLEHLNMSYTNIEIINRLTFSKMPRLKSLILSGNKIKSWASGFLNYLSRLVLLELNNCGVTHLDSTVFHGITSHSTLEELRLSRNPLKKNKFTTYYFQTFLPKLNSLDLSYCDLISYSPFQKYAPTLRRLLLNNNKMDGTLDIYSLNHPTVLRYLDMRYNYFTSIALHHLPYSDNMTDSSNITLKLNGNPWICDCRIWSMSEWVKRSSAGTKHYIEFKKETNSLVCNFDGPAVTSKVQYTWARYMSEFEKMCYCEFHHQPKSSCHYG